MASETSSTSTTTSNLLDGIEFLPFSPFNTLFPDPDSPNSANQSESQTAPFPQCDHEHEHDTPTPNNVQLSVEDLVRIAASKFIQSRSIISSVPLHIPDPTLSNDESERVESVKLLLKAAENVGDRQFDSARSALHQCDRVSSPVGDPIQRLVFYYTRALRDRIDRETGRMASRQVANEQSFDLYKVMMNPGPEALEFHRRIPFTQVTQFAGIQSIVEHVEGAKRIHVVDLAIRNGQQWTILMQALVSQKRRRVEHLKITAVATMAKDLVQQTGDRLVRFARTMNLTCTFHVIMVPDFAALTSDLVLVDANELVVVFAEHVISTLTEPPERLDSLIKAVRELNPWVMVMTEVEANQNSPVFANRFVETLFFVAAYLDCLDTCMGREEPLRKFAEATLLGEGSRIVVAIEGRERIIRNMKVEVWRAYFGRFGMVEAQLSTSALYQAELVAKRLPSWGGCTVKYEGKSLIVGWKGTAIKSVTAWKFGGRVKRGREQ